MSDNNNKSDDKFQSVRLCHIVIRENFDGYGFNLHAEKGKPGQYIGKVDDNSPASVAGLREGDRIIEVNGVNIGNETHKQVVQRIKAVANEVRLLVADSTVQVGKDNQIISQNENGMAKQTTPSPSKSNKSSSNNTANNNNNINNNNNNNNNNNSNSKNYENSTTPPPLPSANGKSSSPTNTDHQQKHSNGTSNHTQSKSVVDSMDKQMENIKLNDKPVENKTTADMKSEGLKLPMTAAEMRMKLASKKKHDPKTDSVDLRIKYDIIQKL